MRILQIISVAAPHYGGPSIGAVSLWRAFQQLGVKSRLLAGAYADPTGRALSSEARDEIASGEDVIWLAPRRPFGAERSAGAIRCMLREVRRADVVHIHGQYMWVHFIAFLALCVWRRPYGLQFHGTLEPYQLAKSPRRKAVYDALVGHRLLRGASYVLFASEVEAERATRVSREKSIVLPLGASLDAAVRPLGLDQLIGDRPRAQCVLFLGRLAAKKRPELLLQAWARAHRDPNALLIIAGPEGDWTALQLRSLAGELGVEDSVRVVGPVDGGEKTWLLERCGVFVLPSDNENFAITVAEAMLAGEAVIVTDQVAASEHVSRANCGYVIPSNDLPALTASLTDLQSSSESRVRGLGEAGREYARKALTWEALAAGLLDRIGTLVVGRTDGRLRER